VKQLIAFDLDGTLAESKAPLDDEIAGLLATLLTFAQVAVISGVTGPN
jgi:hydroxymethylpyrimidine pyrophosphatase-like HAD family hydrolase